MKRLSYGRLERLLEGVLKPSRYTGQEIHCKSKDPRAIQDLQRHVFMALIFPDIYEIGMSNLGISILYDVINAQKDFTAERVFLPWTDLEEKMIKEGIDLFSLENRFFLSGFDLLGFSIAHEMLYSNVLNILKLGRIPLRAAGRKEGDPIVCAGGASVANPMPLSAFMDFFVIGDGEEAILDVLKVLQKAKKERSSRKDFLKAVSRVEGIFVPSLHRTVTSPGGKTWKILPERKIKKAVVKDIAKSRVSDFLIANTKPVHDRLVMEIMRGCPRRCAFCQARTFYSPVRLKDPDVLARDCLAGLAKTGYDEVSFLSLSTSDYRHLETVIDRVKRENRIPNLSISLPSLRLDSFSLQLAESIQSGRKTGLTFAPEAGTQRLRDIIDKDIETKSMMECIQTALASGWEKVKLYFMIGLPFEKDSDIDGIAQTVRDIIALARDTLPKGKRARLQVNVSVNAFCPKPHTPFQWARQESIETLEAKFRHLLKGFPKKHAAISWSVPQKSLVESALSRGDGTLCDVIEEAFRMGARLDNWTDHFDYSIWEEAFARSGIELQAYACRPWDLDETLPWDMIDIGISKAALKRQYQRAERMALQDGRE